MEGSEDLVTENAEMCEMLGEQYVSAYSVPIPNVELPSNDNDLYNHGISVLTEVQQLQKRKKRQLNNFAAIHRVDLMDYQQYY